MARVNRTKSGGKFTRTGVYFTKANYYFFGLSALVLLVGYWALAQPPVDGFLSLTLAPILLVVGYCVLIPVAIIYTHKGRARASE